MKKVQALLLAVALLLPIAAVSGETQTSPGGTLVVASTTKMNGNFLTAFLGNNTADIDVRSLLHGYSVVAWTKAGRSVIDGTVVHSINKEKAENGDRVYKINLNKKLCYSDGSPITAKDYVFYFLLFNSPNMRSIYPMGLTHEYIAGFYDYINGATPFISGVRLTGDYSFSIQVKKEFLPNFYEMNYANAQPLPINVILPGCEVADNGEGAYIKGEWDSDTLLKTVFDAKSGYQSHPCVTSGPYRLVSYDFDSHEARFEINPYFLGNYEGQKPAITQICFKEIKNDEILTALSLGQVDLVNKVSDGDVISRALDKKQKMGIAAKPYDRTGSAFLTFSCERPIIGIAAVRQAVSYCIDKFLLPERFLNGYGVPVRGYYGQGQWMVKEAGKQLNKLNEYALDLDKAENLVVSAGFIYNEQGEAFKKGQDTLRFRKVQGNLEPLKLVMAVTEQNKAANLLFRMLESNFSSIGGKITAAVYPFDVALAKHYRQQERDYDMLFHGSNFYYLFDPSPVFNSAKEYQGSYNTSGIIDTQLEDLADKVCKVKAGDRAAYLKNWMEFQERFVEVLPMVPLYSNEYYDLFTTKLKGYKPDRFWNWGTAILYAALDK